ncbi:hypothetical protein BDY21DRAFT_367011 [Lineolata rhizophorae]|uniref:Uncharacterized protein n=1 Tax=Lineolata rhizophorae TaxID=578093 RepID=A0A6A6NNV9_9PEZI|nr:hypothetical protein BDY21DRAFT_367011 [Lineolata rhizophorae]
MAPIVVATLQGGPPPPTETAKHNGGLQVMPLDMRPEVLEELLNAIRSGKPPQLHLGRVQTIKYGSKTHVLDTTRERHPHELYQAEGAAMEGALQFRGVVGHRLAVQEAEEVTAGTDVALERLKSSLASLQQEKEARQTDVETDTLELPPTSKSSAWAKRKALLKRPAVLSSTPSRSLSASPNLSALASPSQLSAPPTSNPLQKPDLSEMRNAKREAVLYLLAIRPIKFSDIRATTKMREAELAELLPSVATKVGEGARSAGLHEAQWRLRDKMYQEIQPWAFGYADADRRLVVDNCVRAYDRLRLSPASYVWQLLLPRRERGKGVCLSKLGKLHDGPLQAPSPRLGPGGGGGAAAAAGVGAGFKKGGGVRKTMASVAKERKEKMERREKMKAERAERVREKEEKERSEKEKEKEEKEKKKEKEKERKNGEALGAQKKKTTATTATATLTAVREAKKAAVAAASDQAAPPASLKKKALDSAARGSSTTTATAHATSDAPPGAARAAAAMKKSAAVSSSLAAAAARDPTAAKSSARTTTTTTTATPSGPTAPTTGAPRKKAMPAAPATKPKNPSPLSASPPVNASDFEDGHPVHARLSASPMKAAEGPRGAARKRKAEEEDEEDEATAAGLVVKKARKADVPMKEATKLKRRVRNDDDDDVDDDDDDDGDDDAVAHGRRRRRRGENGAVAVPAAPARPAKAKKLSSAADAASATRRAAPAVEAPAAAEPASGSSASPAAEPAPAAGRAQQQQQQQQHLPMSYRQTVSTAVRFRRYYEQYAELYGRMAGAAEAPTAAQRAKLLAMHEKLKGMKREIREGALVLKLWSVRDRSAGRMLQRRQDFASRAWRRKLKPALQPDRGAGGHALRFNSFELAPVERGNAA